MLLANKQAVSIKLATTVGHFYVALTLTWQMFILLDHLVIFKIGFTESFDHETGSTNK